ncbi:MAG: hypothetical protein SGARI_002117 [Bacillariaceae sp.]
MDQDQDVGTSINVESAKQDHPSQDNVMVVSWLTPTNNHGQFLMTLNKRRCTAQGLVKAATTASHSRRATTEAARETVDTSTSKAQFTLSVPVAGMEHLILAVGGTSGRIAPKFRPTSKGGEETAMHGEITAPSTNQIGASMSKRQQKKKRHLAHPNGIPGLRQAPFGSFLDETKSSLSSATTTSGNDNATGPSDSFCIAGTVAHMLCQVNCIIGLDQVANESAADATTRLVDDAHYLVSATVVDAYCHSDYWNKEKNLFRPIDASCSPYLTFFGAQTFGYVHGDCVKTDMKD